MSGGDVVETLLARIADTPDGTLYVSVEELSGWPKVPVAALKAEGLLRPASPSRNVTCDGCERRCRMPVEVLEYPDGPAAFVFCDKLDDVDRVEVPVERLTRWQCSGQALADFLARTLQAKRQTAAVAGSKKWPVGMVRGKRSAHIELQVDGVPVLEMAGHVVPVADVLTLKEGRLLLDRQRLIECVDNPLAGGGTPRSAAERAATINQVAKEKGVKAAADQFGVSEGRIKQITARHRKRISDGK